jgi:hypothetical protein
LLLVSPELAPELPFPELAPPLEPNRVPVLPGPFDPLLPAHAATHETTTHADAFVHVLTIVLRGAPTADVEAGTCTRQALDPIAMAQTTYPQRAISGPPCMNFTDAR